jgi:hypothetical protein
MDQDDDQDLLVVPDWSLVVNRVIARRAIGPGWRDVMHAVFSQWQSVALVRCSAWMPRSHGQKSENLIKYFERLRFISNCVINTSVKILSFSVKTSSSTARFVHWICSECLNAEGRW